MINNPQQALQVHLGLPPGWFDQNQQPTPQLTTQLSRTGNVLQGHWGSTVPDGNTTPDLYLLTEGAGPCLNVIVHNRAQHQGCLTHISFGTYPISTPDPKDPHGSMIRTIGEDPEDKQGSNQTQLFAKAVRIISALVSRCRSGHPQDPLDIWLGSGYAFHLNSGYIPQPVAPPDLPTVLQQRFHGPTIQIHSANFIPDAPMSHDPGYVFYNPQAATVFVLEPMQMLQLPSESFNRSKQTTKIGGPCTELR